MTPPRVPIGMDLPEVPVGILKRLAKDTTVAGKWVEGVGEGGGYGRGGDLGPKLQGPKP